MLQIIEVILPVFLVIVAGYLSSLKKIISLEQAGTLMKFAVNFSLPCLLFLGAARLDLEAAFKFGVLFPYYFAALLNFTAMVLLFRFVFRKSIGDCIPLGFSAIFANTVLMGLAVVELAYGKESMNAAIAIVAINAPFCFAVGILSMELLATANDSLAEGIRNAVKEIFSNAPMVALIAGFLINLTRTNLPQPAVLAIEYMASAALPVALFSLGAALVGYRIATGLKEATLTAFAKLAIHPALAFCIGNFLLKLPADLLKPVVIMAAMPSGINAWVFASMYNRSRDIASSVILLTIGASVFSISLWLILLG